jgi:hypothetical protein
VLFSIAHPEDGRRRRPKHVGVINKQRTKLQVHNLAFFIKLALMHGVKPTGLILLILATIMIMIMMMIINSDNHTQLIDAGGTARTESCIRFQYRVLGTSLRSLVSAVDTLTEIRRTDYSRCNADTHREKNQLQFHLEHTPTLIKHS